METENIKKELYEDFKKWYNINYWHKINEQPKKEHVKKYLGYFGINNRGNIEYK